MRAKHIFLLFSALFTSFFLSQTALAECRMLTAAAVGVTSESDYKCAPEWDLETLREAQEERLQGEIAEEELTPVEQAIRNVEEWKLRNQTAKVARQEAVDQIVTVFVDTKQKTAVKPFPDVAVTATYADVIATAKAEDIVEGYADGLFRPEQNMTRAEATKIVVLGSNLNRCIAEPSEVTFDDVEIYAWYSPVLSIAQELQIAQGYSLEEFQPNQEVTQGELSVLLGRALRLKAKLEDACE
jgi:hypothetical protein